MNMLPIAHKTHTGLLGLNAELGEVWVQKTWGLAVVNKIVKKHLKMFWIIIRQVIF